MTKILLLILISYADTALCQESIDLGRRHRQHVDMDTLDGAPVSFEYFKRYEIEAAAGQAYSSIPQNALAKDQVRGSTNNYAFSGTLKFSYYLKPKLNVGVSVNWDRLGYSFQNVGSSANIKFNYATPALVYSAFARYGLGRIYVEGSAGYIVIRDYKRPADFHKYYIGPVVAKKDAKGFAPGGNVGYKLPFRGGHISLLFDVGIRWMMTDVCKGTYYTGSIGLSCKFKNHQVVHED